MIDINLYRIRIGTFQHKGSSKKVKVGKFRRGKMSNNENFAGVKGIALVLALYLVSTCCLPYFLLPSSSSGSGLVGVMSPCLQGVGGTTVVEHDDLKIVQYLLLGRNQTSNFLILLHIIMSLPCPSLVFL